MHKGGSNPPPLPSALESQLTAVTSGRGGASKRSTGWNIKVAHAGGVGETEEATQGGGVCGNRQKPQQRMESE